MEPFEIWWRNYVHGKYVMNDTWKTLMRWAYLNGQSQEKKWSENMIPVAWMRTNKAMRKVVSWVEKEGYDTPLYKHPMPGWLNAQDVLPDSLTNVLLHQDTLHGSEIVIGFYSKDAGTFLDSQCNSINNITHWMPLPKLPKEEDK